MSAYTLSSEHEVLLQFGAITISPQHWTEGDRIRLAGPVVTLYDEFIRITELRKTIETMRGPIVAVGTTRNRTSAYLQRRGCPERYRSMHFVSAE